MRLSRRQLRRLIESVMYEGQVTSGGSLLARAIESIGPVRRKEETSDSIILQYEGREGKIEVKGSEFKLPGSSRMIKYDLDSPEAKEKIHSPDRILAKQILEIAADPDFGLDYQQAYYDEMAGIILLSVGFSKSSGFSDHAFIDLGA